MSVLLFWRHGFERHIEQGAAELDLGHRITAHADGCEVRDGQIDGLLVQGGEDEAVLLGTLLFVGTG
ncbi:hypothetical protein D3C80_2140340 [compost metagenome]